MQLRSRPTGETHEARGGEEGLAAPGRRLLASLTGHQPGSSLDSDLVNVHGDSVTQPWLVKSLVSRD